MEAAVCWLAGNQSGVEMPSTHTVKRDVEPGRRVGRLLTVAVFACAALASCAILPADGRGTEECAGCRSSRSVIVTMGLDMYTPTMASSGSDWILEQLPSHQHHYVRTGGWSSGGRIARLASRVPCERHEWVEFLKSRDPAEVPAYVNWAMFDNDWRLKEEVYRWRVARDPDRANPHREADFARWRAEEDQRMQAEQES